jgi:hypothetical protein
MSISLGSNAVLEDLLIISNHTSSDSWAGGGGIGIGGGSSMLLRNSEIRNNSCFDYGGGLNIRTNSDVVLENVLIQNNICRNYDGHGKGGGLHIDYGATVEMSNCEVSANHSNRWGGGFAIGWDANVKMLNTTIADNSAVIGGGSIYFNWENIYVTLGNVISYNNTPQEIFYDDVCIFDTLRVFYSDIEGGQQGIVNNNWNEILWLDGNIRADPVFMDPTALDYSLHEVSPCVDAGIALYTYNSDTLIFMRPDEYIGVAPDMGCHEYDPFVGTVDFQAISDNDIFIYPNPARDFLNIDLKGLNAPLEFVIISMEGKVVLESVMMSDSPVINISALEEGLYLLSITADDFASAHKVMISR